MNTLSVELQVRIKIKCDCQFFQLPAKGNPKLKIKHNKFLGKEIIKGKAEQQLPSPWNFFYILCF